MTPLHLPSIGVGRVVDRPRGLALIGLLLLGCTAQPASVATPTSRATLAPAPAASASAVPTASPTPSPTPNYEAVPKIANSKAGLIEQLVTVEAAIRDPRVTGRQLDWSGHLQQLVYSTLADSPEWQPDALAALPETTRPAVSGALEAIKQTRLIHGPTPKTLPDWKILTPKPIDTLLGFYREAEAKYGVPWEYLAAIHLIETRMGRIRGLSTSGAQGPMQFMPPTWAAYGTGDVYDDHDAIMGAANYLKANGAPGDMQRALYAYNHSQPYVNAMTGYAKVLTDDPSAYRGYHGWQVYYTSEETGTVLLPEGWTKPG